VEDLARRLAEQHPEDKVFGVRVFSRLDLVSTGIRPTLILVMGAVAAVLLIACANIANLLLIRATDRRREIALRQALGAPRGRLLSQLLVESLVLSGLGGLLGCLAAAVGLEPLVAGLPFALPRAAEIGVDLAVLGFAALLSVLVGLVVGVLPALRATGVTALDSLRGAGRSPNGSLGRSRAQAALVVSEVALVFLLLTVGGLFIRSFGRLSHVDLGFDPERVLLVRVPTPAEFKQRDPRTLTFLDEVAARLSTVPGVAAVGAASEIPFEGYSTPPTSVETPTGVVQENIHSTVITPGYLRVLGMAVVAGRTLADGDREGSTPVALVSEAFVRRYWSAGNPLGRRIRIDVPVPPYPRWLTVVGVVRDVRYAAASKPIPVVYLPLTQDPQPGMAFMVKAAVRPSAIAAAVRTTLQRMNPDAAAEPVALLDRINQSDAYRLGRFAIVLFGALAAAASVLAALGIYGVLAYAVARRTHEIGVRVALGASTGSVLRRLVGFGLALAGIGGAVGLVGAAALTRTLQGLLFEVSPTDPATIAAAALLVAVTAAAASYVPARRATRIDPWQALRSE
jgi:putative ABC transport system permease protein